MTLEAVSSHHDPRPPRASSRVVITKHADFRLHERAPNVDLDTARSEVIAALLSHRFRHQGHGYWLVWTPGGHRAYAIARGRRDSSVIVVLTVLVDSDLVAAA